MLNRMANFLNLVFLITLPPEYGLCIDASRRQLQYVLKIRVQDDFLDEIMAILVLLDHFWILAVFS
jgi:hypothetical protein